MVRVFLVLLVAAVTGALFTKPDIEAHRKVATALFMKGIAAGGEGARTDDFQDMFVVSKYTAAAGGRTLLECWGAFTRFLCTEPDAGQATQDGGASS